MVLDNTVTIIPFSNDFKEDVKNLNLEWLKKYFRVEAIDHRVLSDPKGEIIDKGGMIFLAKYANKIVGTFSLIKIENATFELSKMAVTDGVQGLGIGNKLMEHCIAVAKEKGIHKIILYSNRKLLPAIFLYEKFGFIEVFLEAGIYERADIKMEKIICK